ncbi:sugar transferase [Staphylococcus chromogenes]|uniref:sugar transferase n=1 Tax=Staphylococcus chromogenes TaxID=46126 RepID=UPI0021D211A8|nr:sugar transferase [Staphylococcus chromogenes]UXS68237.1 sugar transferase [Staphylococcus chromogenes]
MKRLIDVSIAIFVLVYGLPVYLSVSLIVRIFIGKPIYFQQVRSGKYGKPFKIIKFRTMNNKTDENGNLLPNEMRLSRIGSILRVLSLDELPQFINVLKGDLSIVGPRPLHMEYNNFYNMDQKKRLLVKPGITGLAQINGRNAISWTDKFKYDAWYVDNQNMRLDLYIILKTFKKVIKGSDVNGKSSVQVERFNGKN